MDFKKNIIRVFGANFINMLVGIVTGLVIPIFLSVSEYASLKTFTFYLSYIGLLHFGFVDGQFLKYGGKEIEEVNIEELKGESKFFFLFQGIITVFFIVLSIILKDEIIFLFSLCIIPLNMQALYKFFYQATGEFKLYSKITNMLSFFILVMISINIFVLKNSTSLSFCVGYIIIYYGLYVYLLIKFNQRNKVDKVVLDKDGIHDNFRSGIGIMIGNFSVLFFLAIDRWFVKIAFDSTQFAYYSFAVSMMTFITVMINSVTTIMYNYLAKGVEEKKIREIKSYLVVVGMFASGAYFVFGEIIKLFIEKYIPSLYIIAFLFATFPFMIVINAIYINLYKVKKMQKTYVTTVFKMLICAGTLNSVAVILFGSSVSVACATLISFAIWYLYSMKHFNFTKGNLKDAIYIILGIAAFLLNSHLDNLILGFVFYYVLIMIFSFIYKKDEIINFVTNNNLKKYFKFNKE
ncbi:MAG: capsular biosynthesis protein [Clostridium sp.]|nr:capsular biosynthesis protein [Clostridium sp.]